MESLVGLNRTNFHYGRKFCVYNSINGSMEEILSYGYHKELEWMTSLEKMVIMIYFDLIFIIVQKFWSPTFQKSGLSWIKYVY